MSRYPHEAFKNADKEENPLVDRLRGRADYLRVIGRIKDAELMEGAAAELDFLRMSLQTIGK